MNFILCPTAALCSDFGSALFEKIHLKNAALFCQSEGENAQENFCFCEIYRKFMQETENAATIIIGRFIHGHLNILKCSLFGIAVIFPVIFHMDALVVVAVLVSYKILNFLVQLLEHRGGSSLTLGTCTFDKLFQA